MKPYKSNYQSSLGFDIINPIVPRMDVFDGIGSLLNLTGDYYPINPMIDELCEVSKRISTVNLAWSKIYEDLNKSVIDFSAIHKLPQPSLPIKYPTFKFDSKPWEMY